MRSTSSLILLAALSALVIGAGCAGSTSNQTTVNPFAGTFTNGTLVNSPMATTITITGTIDATGNLTGTASSTTLGNSPMSGTVTPGGQLTVNMTFGGTSYRGQGTVLLNDVNRDNVGGSVSLGPLGQNNPPSYDVNWVYN